MKKNKENRTKHADNSATSESPQSDGFQTFRECVESVVIAFVLAFLFRTFEAEAFVIPTGSMSPSLLGQHKDVNCPKCDYRFTITDSDEESDYVKTLKAFLGSKQRFLTTPDGHTWGREEALQKVLDIQVVGGECPMCRFTTPVRSDLPPAIAEEFSANELENQPTYPGDRILVNKFGFSLKNPQRWDVVVFKFPGNGNMNYIKRLTGLPGEVLQVYQGDLFARSPAGDAPFKILHKPADKVKAMLHPVHDSQHESAELYEAGWPLRWAATTPNGWDVQAEAGEQTVQQTFHVEPTASGESPAWLRYRHLLPDADAWQVVRTIEQDKARTLLQEAARPELIADFNAYNAKLSRGVMDNQGWRVPDEYQGLHWVGDLAVECEIEVEQAQGKLLLDLVEAGKHFRCTIDLKSGAARLQIVDGPTGETLDFAKAESTGVDSTGSYELRFANVDDQLLLWVDDELVAFDKSAYDPEEIWGSREQIVPWAAEDASEDQGDLSPVGIGSQDAELTITRLSVHRDIYYLALNQDDGRNGPLEYEDFMSRSDRDAAKLQAVRRMFATPEAWSAFSSRQKRSFAVDEDQYFVMGDNSQFSQDARLWSANTSDRGIPGGAYLDRNLLIGRAVCVFWPHSWGGVPGLPMLPGLPNIGDMRLVR